MPLKAVAHDAFKYQINAKQGEDTAEILIYGDIGDSWYGDSITAAKFVKDLQAVDADYLDVRINSYGGSVSDGLAIYNALKRHKAAVNVHIDGVAMSIATLIAMAGDTVNIAANALFMVHAPWGGAAGNAKDMRDFADILDMYAEAMASSYVAKTGKSQADVLALLTDGIDHYYSADEALAEGFVDAITDAVAVAACLPRDRFTNLPAAAAAFIRNKESTMTTKQTTAATEPTPPNVTEIEAAAQAKAMAKLKERNDQLAGRFAGLLGNAAVKAEYDAIMADPAITVEAATDRILAKMGEGCEPLTPAGHHVTLRGDIVDEKDKFRAAAGSVFAHRMGISADDRGNHLRGMALHQIAAMSLEAAGVRVRGMTKSEIASKVLAAHSTSDFPYLLADAANKKLQNAYETFPSTWQKWCAVGSVSDFKTVNLIRMGSFNSLDEVKEYGEYKQGTVSEEREQLTPKTKGKYIQLSRQMIINDDLSGFARMAQLLGRAAARTVNADVYSILNTNGNMNDGVPLFHATHVNLAGSGGAISVTTLSAGRAAMRMQKAPGATTTTEYLNIMPRYVLTPVGKEDAARIVVESAGSPDDNASSAKKNPIQGWSPIEVLSDPLLDATSTTAWYLAADPNDAPLVEVHFLDGNQTPFVDSQEEFLSDAIQWKVRLDYGTKANEWRGGYKNAGA